MAAASVCLSTDVCLSLSDFAPEQSWTKDQDVKCRSSRQSGEFMRLARLSVTLVRKDVEDEEL